MAISHNIKMAMHKITVRMEDKDFELLQSAAEILSLKMSTYCRMIAIKKAREILKGNENEN